MARVLLVENDGVCRADIAEILRENGYDVEEARNGKEALERLDQLSEAPILILLDLGTPIMNGWEFRRAQLAHPRHRSVPVALMTGDARAAEHARELAAGLLKKPFDLGSLFKLLSEAESAASSR
jgi:CheY-like chemotaxis protein